MQSMECLHTPCYSYQACIDTQWSAGLPDTQPYNKPKHIRHAVPMHKKYNPTTAGGGGSGVLEKGKRSWASLELNAATKDLH